MAILSNNQHIGKYEVTRLIKENNISKDEGLVIVDNFVRHYTAAGVQ